jgi:hypothetical protein
MLSKKLIFAVLTFGIASLGLAQVDRDTLVKRLTNGKARTWTLQKTVVEIGVTLLAANTRLVLRKDGFAFIRKRPEEKATKTRWKLEPKPESRDWILSLEGLEDVQGNDYALNVFIPAEGLNDRLVLSKPLAQSKDQRSLQLHWTSPKK